MKTERKVIPAHPGFYVLMYAYDSKTKMPGGDRYWREPVVAWAIEYGGEADSYAVYALTPGDEPGEAHAEPILYPDGRVLTGSSWCASADEWFAELKADMARFAAGGD